MKIKSIRLPDGAALLERRGLSGGLRNLAQSLAERSDAHAPSDTGALRASVSVTAGKDGASLRYSVPYAAYQYGGQGRNGPLHYRGAPQRGSRWVHRSWEEHREELLSQLAAEVGGHT